MCPNLLAYNNMSNAINVPMRTKLLPLFFVFGVFCDQLYIQSKVGDGSFGEVFQGRLWGTPVAIKVLKMEQLTPTLLDDLKREISILRYAFRRNNHSPRFIVIIVSFYCCIVSIYASTLRHPNMVLYIGACTKPPNVCIVTGMAITVKAYAVNDLAPIHLFYECLF